MVACALRLHPAVPSSGVRCGRACLGLRFGCAPPLLRGVLGCVCARVPVPRGPLHLLVLGAVRGCVVGAASRHSWLGCRGVCVFVRAPRLFPAFTGWAVLCGRACWAQVSAVPRPSWLGCWGVLFFSLGGGVSRFGFVVSVAGCPGPGSCGLCPPIPSLSGWVVGSFFFRPSAVCVRLFWESFFLVGRCFWGVPSLVPSGLGVWPPLAVLVGSLVAVGCSLPPPLFFFWGGVRLFLPLPSLGLRTHWSAFSVVFQVAFGGCVLSGRVPAPWVGWIMYTLSSAPLLAGLGSGSAGWAAAPGGLVWLWVRGAGVVCVLSPPRCRF